jgi:6-phosphogluconolactonase (cycloisomerase 2 family)
VRRRKNPARRTALGAPAASALVLAACTFLAACGGTSKDKVATTDGPQYVYAANNGSGTVSGYSLNTHDGTLTELDGSPFSSAPGAFKLAADPAGRLLYVSSDSENAVYGHAIDPATGELSDLAGSPFSVSSTPSDLTIDPSGTYLYIGHGDAPDVISGYAIDPAGGGLTPVPGSPLDTNSTGVVAAVIHPKGRFLYAADLGGNNIFGYAIRSDSGSLTRVLGSPFTVGTQPNAMAVEPTGRFVFVGDAANIISSLYVQTVSGELGLTTPPSIAVSAVATLRAGPTGEFLYAAGGTALHAMTIRNDGVLKNLESQTAGSDLRGLALDAAGVFLYVTDNSTGEILGFSLEASGNLPSALSTSPFAAGIGPAGILTVQVQPAQ